MAAWPAALIAWGPGFTSTAHRHHCVQLLMTLRGSLLVPSGPLHGVQPAKRRLKPFMRHAAPTTDEKG
jgi:hypothetical protein